MVSISEKHIVRTVRIDALDALRAATMILGVFLHGAVPYAQIPMPGLLWPIYDPSSAPIFDVVIWYLHGFRIPLFFLVAGFFAALLCDLRGPREFLRHRFRRIGVPLAVAILVILPPTYYLWGLGLIEENIATWPEVMVMHFRDPQIKEQILGLAHLWFLEYLLVYYLAYYLLKKLLPYLPEFPKPLRLLDGWWRPLTLVAVTFPILWLRPEVYIEYENRWLPDLWELTYYAVFFLVGSQVYRIRDQLQRLVVPGPFYILASLLVFAALFKMLQWRLGAEPGPQQADWVFALATALYSWLAVWGFLGVCLLVFKRTSHRIRFLSDAAYWIYLVHLPLVVVMQLMIEYGQNRGLFSMPSIVGFTVSVSVALLISIISYRYFVRYGVIGKWLHGPKEKAPPAQRVGKGLTPSKLPQAPSQSKGTKS